MVHYFLTSMRYAFIVIMLMTSILLNAFTISSVGRFRRLFSSDSLDAPGASVQHKGHSTTLFHHSTFDSKTSITSNPIQDDREMEANDIEVNIKDEEGSIGDKKKFFIETHGCQMNLADSDIIRSVMLSAGYDMCDVLEDADLILTNTCAIRENAEEKIWQRIKYFESLRKSLKQQRSNQRSNSSNLSKLKPQRAKGYPLIGILGCMGERLKEQFLETSGVNFVVGPDGYRDLPKLLETVTTDQKAANVQLSLEETYADIPAVREAEGNVHAFVTITRGCNNHCSFCIVPYTRGVERSRPVQSILDEISQLSSQGFKEVVLLGQNVNSFFDQSSPSTLPVYSHAIADGFTQRSKPKLQRSRTTASSGEAAANSDPKQPSVGMPVTVDVGEGSHGVHFGELLMRVAEIDPEMRIRFQSPHPKDFPDDVLRLIASTPNICKSLHMPAQHGSTTMLERMHRGYSREAYLGLVTRARQIIGGGNGDPLGSSIRLGISSDFICGFCGETDEEHQDTVSLLREVQFDQAFTYAYSRREQTYAGLFYKDDVPEDVKGRRLQEVIDTFQNTVQARNRNLEIGRLHLVLVEGVAQRKQSSSAATASSAGHNDLAPAVERRRWTGRTDSNKRVIFEDGPVLVGLTSQEAAKVLQGSSLSLQSTLESILNSRKTSRQSAAATDLLPAIYGGIDRGSYVVVQITEARGQTLRGQPVALSSLMGAHAIGL